MVKTIKSLEIEPNAIKPNPFYWFLQKIILIFLIIFLFLTFLGLFGPGILGKRVAGNKDEPLWVEYDQFGRVLSTNELIVHVNTNSVSENKNIQLKVAGKFFDKIFIKQIFPPPISIKESMADMVFEFGPNVKKIIFLFEPQSFGFMQADLGLVNGPNVSYKQFIYP